MTDLQNELIGSLIGLARATEGNSHLVTEELDRLVLKALSGSMLQNSTTKEDLLCLTSEVKKAKESLVPDCFTCANPCGRTNDYDMKNLENAEDKIRSLKILILLSIQNIASFAYRMTSLGHTDKEITFFLYRALFAIGSDWDKEELMQVAMEIEGIFYQLNASIQN